MPERAGRPEPAAPKPDEPAPVKRERPSFVDRERYSMRLPDRFAPGKPETAPPPEPPVATEAEPRYSAPTPAPTESEPVRRYSAPAPAAPPAPAASSGEDDRQARPKRDWRSLRFSSRFAQPPKAYDLDEVGDRELSFDVGESPEAAPEPRYAPEPDVGVAEEDVALRRRFGRVRPTSREPEPRYAAETAPELPYADDELSADDRYAPVEPEDQRDSAYEPEYVAGDYADDSIDDTDDYREPVAEPVEADAYAISESDYAETGYETSEPDPVPAYDEPDVGIDLAPRPAARARDQVVYDDFDLRDREEPPVGPADESGRDDFAVYADESDPLRAEPRAGLDADPASYRGTFEDYEKKSRRGPLVLLLVLGGVAVVAGGLIVGYQMLSPGGSDRVPLVKLEDTPSKVAPDEPGGMKIPHQNKLIYDRIVGEESPVDEQVVPREEPVMDLNSQDGQQQASESDSDLPAPPEPIDSGTASDNGRQEAADILRGNQPAENGQLSQNFGVPVPPPGFTPPGDGQPEADPNARDEPGSTPESSRVETIAPPERTTERVVPPRPKLKPAIPPPPVEPAPRATRSTTGPIQLSRQSDSSGGPSPAPSTAVESAPLSQPIALPPPPAPEAIQQQPRQVARAEPAPAPAPSTGSGDYVIQTAAFRSEEEAQDEYRKLRDKHGALIGNYGPMIQRADLGSRGVYYRLRLGPIASKDAASGLCDSLLAAGEKDCLVRRQ